MPSDNRTRDLANLAVQIAQEDAKAANSIGFLSRIFCQCALPHREPPSDPRTGQAPASWIRKNGSITMRLYPGVADPGKPTERAAYPYGVLPRYLLIFITTAVARNDDSVLLDDGLTIDLGSSMRSFLRQLGLASTGGKYGSIGRLRDQVTRLATSQISIISTREMGDGAWNFRSKNFGMIDEADLWWSDRDYDRNTLWPSTITISPAFRDSIKASAVPVDTRGLALIQGAKGGALAVDLYVWAAHRFYSLRRATTIPWALLAEQFGSQYSKVSDFKASVIKALPVVLLAYPEAKIAPSPDGLVLRPSPLPVAPSKRSVIEG